MLAAKGRTLLGLLALVLAVATAAPAAASLPQPGHLAVDPAALLAAAQEPPAAAERVAFALFDEAPGDRFRLSLEARPDARFHLRPPAETRVWAINLPEPLHIEVEPTPTRRRFKLYGYPRPGIASEGTFLQQDPLGYVDAPSLYQYALNNPANYSDPLGLDTCPECTKQHIRDVQAKEARRQREALESLLFETQWFLAENEFAGHEQRLWALAEHLEAGGFASGARFENLRLATLLIGPAECNGSAHVICHMGGGRAFAEGIEWGVTTAISLLLPELAFSELAVGGTSYVAMLEAVQADARFGRILYGLERSQQARVPGWALPEAGGGAHIGGRWYTEHALERMAPRTPQVMAELESRALARARAAGLKPGTPGFGKWWAKYGPDPRNVPPNVIEAEIAAPGSTGVRVITNAQGDVVTVIPGGG
jgi:hypothetical protein